MPREEGIDVSVEGPSMYVGYLNIQDEFDNFWNRSRFRYCDVFKLRYPNLLIRLGWALGHNH